MYKLFFVFFFLCQYFTYAQDSNYVIGTKVPFCGTYGMTLGTGLRRVVYFPVESYTSGIIDKVEFSFYSHFDKKDTVSMKLPIMLKIYARDTLRNIPGVELLKDTVIIFYQKKKVILDISKYNISLPPDGLYCGLASFSTTWYIEQGYLSADNLSYTVKGPMGYIFYTPMVAGIKNKKGIYRNYVLGEYAKEWKDVTETFEASLFIRLHIRK